MASKRKTPPRPVVVFGDALDLHVLAVEEALASMDVPVVLLPPDGLRAGVPWQAEVLPGGLEVSGLWPPGVDRPRSVWAWRLPPPLIEPGPQFSAYARNHLAMALVLRWQEQGACIINPLEAGHGGQNKPWQLHCLARAGVVVPHTRVCLTPLEVTAAVAHLGDVILKPLAAGAFAQRVQMGGVIPPVVLPCLAQARAPGLDVRVTVVDGKIVGCAGIPVADNIADYRATAAYTSGKQLYTAVTLSAPHQKMVLRAVRALGLVFAGVDVRLDGKALVVLEANPAPAFLDIQEKLGLDVSGALAAALARAR